ncbi:endonuclease III [Candidatus Uhrbacteria bacterium]|nr:endonuclease III [Candidatus Uhrbacteria bacterium]
MTSATRASRKIIVKKIIRTLAKLFPDAKIALRYSNPWELLVAVILSAQCTDKKVNDVTRELFKKYRTLDDYVSAKQRDFEKDIYSTGFYRAKARHILASAALVKKRFNGRVPRTMGEIMSLPGVARKTANVVLGNAYGVVEGIAVDTHVRRLSRRLGLTESVDPNKIEQDLMAIVPKKDWQRITYFLIEYGRTYCSAKKHNHARCPLTIILHKIHSNSFELRNCQ